MKEPGKEEAPSQEENQEETRIEATPISEPLPEETPETEGEPTPEIAPTEEAPEEPSIEEAPEPAEPQPETRSRRILRLSIRWVAGLLIVFLLGVLAAGFLLYRPANQSLEQERSNLRQANQKIAQLESDVSDLEAQIEELRALEEEKQALQEQLDQARSHINILSALSDVNAARLALGEDDLASARAYLTNTPQALDELGELVSSEQMGKVNAMQDRLDLALDILESSPDQAQSDLGVLARDLMELENILFAVP